MKSIKCGLELNCISLQLNTFGFYFAGVTTIAGGKWSRGGGGHVDGPSEEAKFSDDFDIYYIRSSCSLLVLDRGNQAIREIELHYNDCSFQDDANFHLGKFIN